MHRERSYNKAADLLANIVLDSGKNIEEIDTRDFSGIDRSSFCVAIFSDGASRGNPGPSAISACIVVYCGSQEFVVAVSARGIGRATSVHAEWEAACLGRRLLVAWLYGAKMVA